MSVYIRSHLVEDASGAQFQLHEFRAKRPLLSRVLGRRTFHLEAGECVKVVDDNTFALVSTGEAFCRVGRD